MKYIFLIALFFAPLFANAAAQAKVNGGPAILPEQNVLQPRPKGVEPSFGSNINSDSLGQNDYQQESGGASAGQNGLQNQQGQNFSGATTGAQKTNNLPVTSVNFWMGLMIAFLGLFVLSYLVFKLRQKNEK